MGSVNDAPLDWVSYEKPPATKMNSQIRDKWKNLQDARSSFLVADTPAGSGSTAFNWTNSPSGAVQPNLSVHSITARYQRLGKAALDATIHIVLGAGGQGNGSVYYFFLPFATGVPDASPIGTAYLFDASTSNRQVATLITQNNNSNAGILVLPGGGLVGPTNPWAWAVGDIVSMHIRAELAS